MSVRSESQTARSTISIVTPLQLGEEVVVVHYDMPTCQRLLNILDLYDAALGLRVPWIFHDGHV